MGNSVKGGTSFDETLKKCYYFITMGRERPEKASATEETAPHPLEFERASGEREISDEEFMDDVANAPTAIRGEARKMVIEPPANQIPTTPKKPLRHPYEPSELADDAEVMPERRTAGQIADEERWEALQHLAEVSSKKRETSGVLPVETPTAENLVKELLAEHSVQLSLAEKLLPIGEDSGFDDDSGYGNLHKKLKESTEAKALLEGVLLHMHEKKPFTAEETGFLVQEAKKFRRLAQNVEEEAAEQAETVRLYSNHPKFLESLETSQLFNKQIIQDNRERAEALEQLLQEQQKAA